jgi:tetratricopeptide (TPR) repeat protein
MAGHGLFNLVLSLLPAKVKCVQPSLSYAAEFDIRGVAYRSVVGFFGFNHDRKLALRALAVSASRNDVHSVFAGLALMTYYGVVLLMSGYQADEKYILKQYNAIVDKCVHAPPCSPLSMLLAQGQPNIQTRKKVPHRNFVDLEPSKAAHWVVAYTIISYSPRQAKIHRMSGDPESAIKSLQAGLAVDRTSVFLQADALLVFELAWVFLAQRRHEDAAKMFMKMTEINTWSHATYYFIAAGCHWSLGNLKEVQRLLEATPAQIDKRKVGNKDLPTEVFIKKKCA